MTPPAARHRFFAACPRNVADLLAQELREFGVEVEREHPAGVSFLGPLSSAYLACLRSRTASRVLLTLADLDAADPDLMYRGLLELPWETHVAPDGSFAAYVGIPYDEANRRGIYEPVCTHPDHQRQGLARRIDARLHHASPVAGNPW